MFFVKEPDAGVNLFTVSRIKNSIISLIFILFVILTALSIYMNTVSFKGRHNAKAIELLKYVN